RYDYDSSKNFFLSVAIFPRNRILFFSSIGFAAAIASDFDPVGAVGALDYRSVHVVFWINKMCYYIVCYEACRVYQITASRISKSRLFSKVGQRVIFFCWLQFFLWYWVYLFSQDV